jgi:hypothetical protein
VIDIDLQFLALPLVFPGLLASPFSAIPLAFHTGLWTEITSTARASSHSLTHSIPPEKPSVRNIRQEKKIELYGWRSWGMNLKLSFVPAGIS